MLLREAKTLTALKCHESLPTLSRTLNAYQWPLEELMATRRSVIQRTLAKRRKRRGRPHFLYLILDDTVVRKRGRKLPALGFHFSPSEDRVVHGWDWVFAAVRVGSLFVPWDWRSYVNERFLQEEDFQKRTELACELIRSFEPPVPGWVIVLADSVYCCTAVIQAVQARGFTLIGLLKRNRRLADGQRACDAPEETVAYLQGLEWRFQ